MAEMVARSGDWSMVTGSMDVWRREHGSRKRGGGEVECHESKRDVRGQRLRDL
jgi:hypothetical protein